MRSARERHPEAAASIREAASRLRRRGRHPDAAWLLVAFVDAELRRRAPRDAEAATFAALASDGFAAAGDPATATAIAEPALYEATCLPALVRGGALAALEGVEGADNVTLLGWYALLGLEAEGARFAERRSLPGHAARLWLAAGRPLDAARAWVGAGRPEEAVRALLTLSPDHRQYRAACVALVRLAHRAGSLDYALHHFLGGFVDSAPVAPFEQDAFVQLAEVYAAQGNLAEAEALVERVRAQAPEHAGARAWAAPRERTWSLPEPQPLPDLPELPDLPPMPEPSRPAPVTAATRSDPTEPRGTLVPGFGDPPARSLTAGTQGADPPPYDPDAVSLGPGLDLVPDAMIAGRYRVEKVIGRGSMGAVVRALDCELGEPVAVKFMSVPASHAPWMQRFRQELRLTRRLTHPNIVRVHDMGTHESWTYLTMELLQGRDLASRMRTGLMWSEAVAIVEQAAEGLHAAHRAGVVHRDVKPENLFVTHDGVVKVMDFGIARGEGESRMTQAGVVAGTATYMAPEQAAGFSEAGPAADLYSLAVVAYECFSGAPPFQHPDLMPLLMMHAQSPPPPLGPTVPEPIQREILRGLAKSPADRHPDCRAFGAALREAWTESDLLGL